MLIHHCSSKDRLNIALSCFYLANSLAETSKDEGSDEDAEAKKDSLLSESVELYKKSLRLTSAVNGEYHTSAADIYHNLAFVLNMHNKVCRVLHDHCHTCAHRPRKP